MDSPAGIVAIGAGIFRTQSFNFIVRYYLSILKGLADSIGLAEVLRDSRNVIQDSLRLPLLPINVRKMIDTMIRRYQKIRTHRQHFRLVLGVSC